MVIGYAPGGSADAGIRPLARVLEPVLGQPLSIENKPGNAGGVAMEFIAKVPPEAIARLSQALLKAGGDKNLQDLLNATGCDADFLNPAQTVEKIKADSAKWGRVVKDANIKVD